MVIDNRLIISRPCPPSSGQALARGGGEGPSPTPPPLCTPMTRDQLNICSISEDRIRVLPPDTETFFSLFPEKGWKNTGNWLEKNGSFYVLLSEHYYSYHIQ